MIKSKTLTCFNAYDIRGKVGQEINQDIAYRIARAAVQLLDANAVVVGFDARKSSSELADAVNRGIV